MYKIITMEREFASGGNEIGRRVAEKLGVKLFDRTILVEAAKRLDISPIYIGDLEETAPGSIIFNLSKTALGGSKKTGFDLCLNSGSLGLDACTDVLVRMTGQNIVCA